MIARHGPSVSGVRHSARTRSRPLKYSTVCDLTPTPTAAPPVSQVPPPPHDSDESSVHYSILHSVRPLAVQDGRINPQGDRRPWVYGARCTVIRQGRSSSPIQETQRSPDLPVPPERTDD